LLRRFAARRSVAICSLALEAISAVDIVTESFSP